MLAPFERDQHATAPAEEHGRRHAEANADLVWRCSGCGYQRLSAAPPERCPGCGADGSRLIGRPAIEWRFLLRHAKH